jgi:hypothetical protein
MPGTSPGQVYLGVQVLCTAPQAVKMVELAGERELSEEVHIFLPGRDDSGRHDAFLVNDSRHRENAVYRTRVEERSYGLKLDRVRQRGRGWVLAGFEVEALNVPPPTFPEAIELPRFRLAGEDDEIAEDPFRNEVSARLLV